MGRLGEFLINHWVLTLALVTIIVLLIITEMKRKLLGFRDIPTDEAVQLINRQNAVVLDVRDDKEFEEGHIINAVHIPLGLLESRINEIDKHKDKPVIVCCKSGQDSARAGVTLGKQGFEQVYKLNGGIMAWKNANLPVEKAPSSQPSPSTG